MREFNAASLAFRIFDKLKTAKMSSIVHYWMSDDGDAATERLAALMAVRHYTIRSKNCEMHI